MPTWNPSAPDVLGNEWLANVGHSGQVWAGAPAPMARLQSTAAETIAALNLSATVNPLLHETAPTVVDIIEEGNEDTALFAPVKLLPTGDVTINGWRTETGGSANLFNSINENASQWPGPAQFTWIQNTNPNQTYVPTFDVSAFTGAGSHINARIGFVEVRAIYGANTGFRKLRTRMEIGGNIYHPAGGDLRDVHGYGSTFFFWYGEMNPATGKPWVPADIAQFGAAGTSRLYVQSYSATTAQFPKVFALQLWVYCIPVENRAAVAVWHRPDDLTARLSNVLTTSLMTVPSGAATWSKLSGRNYLFYWRQSVSPAIYSAVVADDVRWNLAYQDLGPVGQPPGIAFAPGGILATRKISHDQFGRPAVDFPGTAAAASIGSAAGLALVRSDLATSVDSQPYRLDITDIESVTSTQKLGQRIVPGATTSYLGVRFPIIPPATGTPTLTVAVIRVSDSVTMGGTLTVTAAAARALPQGPGGWRYITGFLSSGASLTSGIAYEIRVTSSAGGTWLMAMPDSSLGPSASFGGTTNGAFIGATHFTDRDLSINLVKQPDPPTNVTAAIVNVPITTYAAEATTIQHVNISWTLPAVGLGVSFARYELERQLDSGPWQMIAKLLTAATTTFQDHEAPRNTIARYRIRAIATDGRYSITNQSGTVTPATTGSLIVLTSNHNTALEAVYIHDRESTYPLLAVERDETVALHATDYQVVFSEAEDRGIGWRTQITITQISAVGKGGQHKLTPLMNLVRATDIPYICVLDRQGTQILGHVRASDASQRQPAHRYTAALDIIPTHTEPVPVTVP